MSSLYYILSTSLINKEFYTLLKLLSFYNKAVLLKNLSSIGSLVCLFCYTEWFIFYFYLLPKNWLLDDLFFDAVLELLELFSFLAVREVDWLLLYFVLLGTEGKGRDLLLN